MAPPGASAAAVQGDGTPCRSTEWREEGGVVSRRMTWGGELEPGSFPSRPAWFVGVIPERGTLDRLIKVILPGGTKSASSKLFEGQACKGSRVARSHSWAKPSLSWVKSCRP